MADFAGIFTPPPTAQVQTGSVGATSSSAEIDLSVSVNGRIGVAVTGGPCNIKFGNSGLGAASASDLPLFANTVYYFNLGQGYSAARIFNSTASSVTYWIFPLFT